MFQLIYINNIGAQSIQYSSYAQWVILKPEKACTNTGYLAKPQSKYTTLRNRINLRLSIEIVSMDTY